MRNIPTTAEVHAFVGTWAEWMDSVGVSWEDENRGCYDCPKHEDEGWPWSCPNICPEKQHQLEWKEIDAETGFGDFWASIINQERRST